MSRLLETVDFICDYIRTSDFNFDIPLTMLKELLLRCTLNVQFKFNDTLYYQLDGVAMGSPLGPILADIFMGKLETGPLKPVIAELPFYRRYVDDIFLLQPLNEEFDILFAMFNSAHSSIEFTSELEEFDYFHFLDVGLSRRIDGTVQRSVYRKSTWTGQYINFNSFVPCKQKRNLVRCLYNRATRICSDDSIGDEISTLKTVLKENGFPDRFINKNMKSRETLKFSTVEQKSIFISLPFRGDLASQQLTNRLNRTLRRTFPAAMLRCWFTSNKLINLRLKDNVPVLDQSMLIYSFSCSCSQEYVGRTTRRLSTRIKEHQPAWLRTGEQKTITSAIVSHLVHTDHKVNTNKHLVSFTEYQHDILKL
jgi:hypothetical protein